MKKRIIPSVVTVLAVSLGAGLLSAADSGYNNPSAANPSQGQGAPTPEAVPGAMPAQDAMGASESAQALPTNWTKAKGTVQSVDAVSKEVKFKDDKGTLSQVTIDPNVTISKNGKKVDVSQLQAGDIITLTRKKTAASDQSNRG